MRKFLLLFSFLAMFAVVKAQDPVVSITTVKANQFENCTSYSANAKLKNANAEIQTWTTYGFNYNNGSWGDIRCGNRNASTDGYTATITTDFAITASVNKVVVAVKRTQTGKADSIKSVNLLVSSNVDMSDATTYSADVAGFSALKKNGTTDLTFEISDPQANKYYQLSFVMPKTTNNGICAVTKIDYYGEILAGTVAAPVISKNDDDMVTISQADGADIHYTKDGTTPTVSSPFYTTPFLITEKTTVKAIAVQGGKESAVTTATFTPSLLNSIAAFLNSKPASAVKINAPLTAVYQCGRNLYLTDGKDFILAYNSNNNEAVTNLAAVNGDIISFISGTYKDQNGLPELLPSAVGEKTTGGAPVQPEVLSIEEIGTDMLNKYVKITGVTITALESANNYNANDGSSDITIYNSFYNASYYPGAITLPDGTKGNTIPEGEGFTLVGFVSCYGSKLQITPVEITGGKVLETVATPVFNPASGELSEGDKITISCETEGATIYYTTDGSTPEVGGNMTDQYTGEITFSDAMTVKAIAVKEGMLDSDVATATYTLKIAGQLTATFDFGTDGNIASLTTVAIEPSNTQTETGANNMKDIPFTNGPIEMMFTTVDGGTTPRWWKTATTPNQLRIYKKNVITFRVIQDGYKIEKIQFDRGTTVSATNFAKIKIEPTATNVEDAAGTWDETNKTWTATSGSVINMVSLSTSTTQETAQLNGFTVVYVADDSAVAGIEGVDADNSDAPVEYYNLQGVRVAADNLTPGIYVCRQGSKVSKVLVK